MSIGRCKIIMLCNEREIPDIAQYVEEPQHRRHHIISDIIPTPPTKPPHSTSINSAP